MATESKPATESIDRDTIARLTTEVVPLLIDRLARSELGELEVREQGWRVRVRRPMNNGQVPASSVPASAAHKPLPKSGHSSTDGHGPRRDVDRGLVTSPAVGYFVPRDGVVAGSAVSSGDLVGHVDVLGVRQEVVSTIDGTVAVVEVEAGQAVEYGQPIARIAAERMMADV